MSPKKPKPLSIPQAIAGAVRRERLTREWSQEDLAQKMSDLGFTWSRMTVTEIERGDPGNANATKREQARQVSVEELLGLTFAFGMGLDIFLWNDQPIELAPAERRAGGGLPLVLNSQLELWIALMGYSSIEQITGAQAAILMKAERERVVSTMTERIDSLADELHSTADWFREEAHSRLIPEPVEKKGQKA
jgi:transcriptional regulator with XRE-family HTH domain